MAHLRPHISVGIGSPMLHDLTLPSVTATGWEMLLVEGLPGQRVLEPSAELQPFGAGQAKIVLDRCDVPVSAFHQPAHGTMGTSNCGTGPLTVVTPPRGEVTGNGPQVSIFTWNLRFPRPARSRPMDACFPRLRVWASPGDTYSGCCCMHHLLPSWATPVP